MSSIVISLEGDLFIVLYDAIINNPDKIGHGRDGFYFGENGEHLWYDISKAIGKALVKRGISESDEPTTFTKEELVKYFGSEVSFLSLLRFTKVLVTDDMTRDICRRVATVTARTLVVGPGTRGRLAGSPS